MKQLVVWLLQLNSKMRSKSISTREEVKAVLKGTLLKIVGRLQLKSLHLLHSLNMHKMLEKRK